MYFTPKCSKVNECVVASNRVKEAMERELHSTRLDLELNVQCVTMRTNRPDAEKVRFLFLINTRYTIKYFSAFQNDVYFYAQSKDPDRADDMLAVEKQQLQRQKRELENHLQCIQSSLQVCQYHYALFCPYLFVCFFFTLHFRLSLP